MPSHRVRLARTSRFAATALLVIAPAVSAADIYVLFDGNRLARVEASAPETAGAGVAVSGMAAGDTLMAIDVRPNNGHLYGLAYNGGTSSLQLYHLHLGTGTAIATPIGNAGQLTAADGVSPVVPTNVDYDIDFSPAVDRLRVVNGAGLNLRINPNTGRYIDFDPAIAGVNPDGAINGSGVTGVVAAAYTNNTFDTAITTLYTLDSASNRLFLQVPPNIGTQTSGALVRNGGQTLDFDDVAGFDIPPGAAAPSANQPATGRGYALFRVGNATRLYTLDLATAQATPLGTMGGNVRDIAIAREGSAAYALLLSQAIMRFDPARPQDAVVLNLTGQVPGEEIVGIDGRPSNGQLLGVGIDTNADLGTLYLVDPQTGSMTPLVTPGGIAFTSAGGTPIDFVFGNWGVDVDPVTDWVRVVSDRGLNFRVSPVSGAGVDGDIIASGTNPDGMIEDPAAYLAGAAYTNNHAGAAVSTLYVADLAQDMLHIQRPQESGNLVASLPLLLDGNPVTFSASTGFDIPEGVDVATAGSAASGIGYLSVSSAVTTLNAVDLGSGALQVIGPLGDGTRAASGLVVWKAPVFDVFGDGFE